MRKHYNLRIAFVMFIFMFGAIVWTSSTVEAKLTSVDKFTSKDDPLFDEIKEAYGVTDETDLKGINAALKELKEDVQENGLDGADLSFLGRQSSKPKKDKDKSKKSDKKVKEDKTIEKVTYEEENVVDDKIKTGLMLPSFPRKEDGKIVADIFVGTNTDIYYGEDWTVELQKVEGEFLEDEKDVPKWKIVSGKVTRIYQNRYKNGAVLFKRYKVNDTFNIKLDSIEFEVRKGYVYLGHVLGKQDKGVAVCIDGQAMVEFTPPDKMEKHMLRHFSKKDEFKEKTDFMTFILHQDNFDGFIKGWPISPSFDEAKEKEAKEKIAKFLKSPSESFDAYYKDYTYFFENRTNVDCIFSHEYWEKMFYSYQENNDDTYMGFEEVFFGQRKRYALTDWEGWRIWNAFNKEEERAWKDIKDPEEQLRTRIMLDRPKHERLNVLKNKTLTKVDENVKNISSSTRTDVEIFIGGYDYINLDLAGELKVSDVIDGQGRSYRTRRSGSELRIFFPEKLKEGQKLTFFLKYSGEVIYNFRGGLNYVSLTWVPDYGYLGRAQYDALIGAPKGQSVVSVGYMEDEFEEDGLKYHHWKEDVPVALPGFMVANYVKRISKYDDVKTNYPDKPFEVQGYITKDPLKFFQEVGSFFDVEYEGYYESEDVEEYRRDEEGKLVEIGGQKSLERMLQEAHVATKFFSEMFTPYPYRKLAMVQLPYWFGFGQGQPSMLILWGWAFLSRGDREKFGDWFFSGRVDLEWVSEFLAHEISHQWWGHVVPWYTYHDQWLSESFAQISCAMYVQSRRGHREYWHTMQNWERWGKSVANDGAIWLGGPRLPGSYVQMIYEKGGFIMHTLRMLLPTDKDGKEVYFQRCIQNLAKVCRGREEGFKAASSLEFKVICEKTLGEDNLKAWFGEPTLDWFFDEWVYGWGYPEYGVRFRIDKASSGTKVTVKLLQMQGEDIPIFKMPLNLYFHFKDGSREIRRIINSKKEEMYQFEFDKRCIDVKLDEFDHVMCDIEYGEL